MTTHMHEFSEDLSPRVRIERMVEMEAKLEFLDQF